MPQFPVSELPGLLGGLESGLSSANLNMVANTPLNLTAGMALADRKLLAINNPNAGDIYFSDNPAVTVATGFPLSAGDTVGLEF
jgi:hypothetical protein